MLAEKKGGSHQKHRHRGHGVQKLLGGKLCVAGLPAAQVLGHHHGAAGGKGGEDLNDECVDIIHQRHPGNRRFSYIRYHNAVRHPDQYG